MLSHDLIILAPRARIPAAPRTAIATARMVVATTDAPHHHHHRIQDSGGHDYQNDYLLCHNHLHSPEHSESGVSNSNVAWVMPISASLSFKSAFKFSISDRLSTTTWAVRAFSVVLSAQMCR